MRKSCTKVERSDDGLRYARVALRARRWRGQEAQLAEAGAVKVFAEKIGAICSTALTGRVLRFRVTNRQRWLVWRPRWSGDYQEAVK